MAKDYNNWTKEQLVEEVKRLRKRKKYGLVWEDKPEDVVEQCKTELPVLKEVKNRAIAKDKNGPVNILIEGDNYHALSVLNYTHRGKIDVIYIDPPYNTGHNDFKYNDKYIDSEDTYRHSKWLSFMKKRLVLARTLLKKTGVIFISIDDNEQASLKLLCDELFQPKNFVGQLVVYKGTSTGQDAQKFSSSFDYLIVYKKNTFELRDIPLSEKDKARFSKKDKRGYYAILQFRKTGKNDRRENRPNLYYPLPAPDKTKVYPIGPTGYESTWRTSLATFKMLEKEGLVVWIKQVRGWVPYIKYYAENRGKRPSNLWIDIEGNKKASIELRDIFNNKVFENPKPTDLIKRIIQVAAGNDAIILDFFAGSGTTGHAVLELNKDGGERRFFLCTNNENNIATEVCHPRIAKVIEGYKDAKGKKVAGIKGNLKYFRTAFVGAEPNDKNKEALTKQATEMLCMREDTFEPVKETGAIKIFKNSKQHTGIIFDENAIPAIKKDIAKIGGVWSVYIFSLGDDTFEEEFEDMKQKISVAPIPEAILRVYRRLFKP